MTTRSGERDVRKVGVVGVGAVGQGCAFALVLRGSCRELVLVDRIADRATAAAIDMRYGGPLSPSVAMSGGDWSDLAGADVVLICAGVNEKGGGATDRDDPRGRMKLLDTNASVYRDVVARVVAVAPDAVLVAVTDPPDPLADLTRALAGHDRVLSTGTTIDTLRFRVHVAAQLGVHPSAVEGLVVGEHGTSEVMLWSSVRVAGTPLADALGLTDPRRSVDDLREQVEREVRFANITIIEAVLGDERVVMPVAAYRERYDVTIGLPTVVGRDGAAGELEPAMSADERRAFDRSAATLREAARRIGVRSR
jgi:L-lactate dehydrogenase